jgi:mono/diheme cytochrome c family protein
MTGFEGGLPGADLDRLLSFLAGGRDLPERRDSMQEKLPRGDAGRGASIFARQCAGCHDPGEKGQVAPTLSSKTFQEKAGDGMILETIARGRPGTAMVAFAGPGGAGFSKGELSDLLAYIRSLASRRK